MTRGQERKGDRKSARPGGERPNASSRTTEAHEGSDQKAIPALEHYRCSRDGDRHEWVPDEAGRDGDSTRHRRALPHGCDRRKASAPVHAASSTTIHISVSLLPSGRSAETAPTRFLRADLCDADSFGSRKSVCKADRYGP